MFSHKKKKRKQKHQQNFSLKKNEYIQEKFVRYILVKQSYFSPRFFECVFFCCCVILLSECFKFAEKKIIILHKSFHPVLSSPLDKSKTFRVENISVFNVSMYLQCLMSDPNLQGPLFLGPTITSF